MKNIIAFLFISIVSCSQVNVEYQDYYKGTYNDGSFRHGVVPTPSALVRGDEIKRSIGQLESSRGERIYKKHCLQCHGVSGRGDGPKRKDMMPRPADLVKLAKDVPFFNFYMAVSESRKTMPGWKQVFSKQDLNDLEHYIRSLYWK